MSGAGVRTLAEWKEICRRAEAEGSTRRALLRTGWASSEITPPPALEDPAARIPLERADECASRARRAADPEERTRWLRRALEWLDHPPPRSSPQLLKAIRRNRREIRSRLGSD